MKRLLILALVFIGCNNKEKMSEYDKRNATCKCGFVWERSHPERYEEHKIAVHMTEDEWRSYQSKLLKQR